MNEKVKGDKGGGGADPENGQVTLKRTVRGSIFVDHQEIRGT